METALLALPHTPPCFPTRNKPSGTCIQQRINLQIPKTTLSRSSLYGYTNTLQYLLISCIYCFLHRGPKDLLRFPSPMSFVTKYFKSAYQNHSPSKRYSALSLSLQSMTPVSHYGDREVGLRAQIQCIGAPAFVECSVFRKDYMYSVYYCQ